VEEAEKVALHFYASNTTDARITKCSSTEMVGLLGTHDTVH